MKNDTPRLAKTLRMKLKLSHHPNSAVLRIAGMLTDEELVYDYKEHEKLKHEKRKA